MRRSKRFQRPPRTDERERGATAVEYAIMVAVVVVPLTLVVNSIQDGQREQLISQSDRIGTPEEPNSVDPFVSNYAGSGGSGGSSGSTISASVSLTGTPTSQGQKWRAVVEAQVVDGSGAPILDAVVTGTWLRIFNDGRVETESAQCNADSAGNCTLSLWNMRRVPHADAVDSVVFTIDNIEGADVTPAPGAVGSSITVMAP